MTPAAHGPYRLEVKKSVVKTLLALSSVDRRRVDAAILSLAGNPRPPGCKSLADTPDLYRVRVGDYRVVYQVQDRVLLILIVRVGNRRDVYRGI